MITIDNTNIMKTELNQELTEKQRRGVVRFLKVLLTDELALYRKLRNYHWNMTGMSFYSLHTIVEAQLDGIAVLIDEIAERVHHYRSSTPEIVGKSAFTVHPEEALSVYPDVGTMVANLALDHETIIRCLHQDIKKIGNNSGGVGVANVLTSFLHQHQKIAWRLHMYLED